MLFRSEDRDHHHHAGNVAIDGHSLEPEDEPEQEIASQDAYRRERRQRSPELRDTHPPCAGAASSAHEGSGAEEQRLLNDDHRYGRKDIVLVTTRPIEQRFGGDRDGQPAATELGSAAARCSRCGQRRWRR